MKNIVFIIILFTNIINSYSQYYKNYNWEKQSLLIDSEGNYKNESSVGFFDNTIIEIVSGKFSNSIIKYVLCLYALCIMNDEY